MNRILRSSLVFILFVSILSAQTADQVFFNQSENPGVARMCLNDAGTIQSFGPHIGQSNDVMGNIIYLCLGDSIFINHANDEILISDPDMSTPAGIGYSFFDCPPTTSGPDAAAIAADPCVTNVGVPIYGFYVYTGDVLSGDVFFFNDGNLQTALNGGAPAIYYFAPITFDEMDINGIAGYEGNPVADCVNLSNEEAFAVAYLNEITITELNVTGCTGSFRVRGGLSELDNSAYTINIFLQSNPLITASVNSTSYNHNDIVTFTAPEAGIYVIEVEDGKSCGASTTTEISACDILRFNFPLTNVLPNTNECLPVTVENFTDLISFQGTINWDPTILSITGTQGYHPQALGLTAGSFAYFPIGMTLDPGVLTFSWTDLSLAGLTLADGEILFEICFDVVGQLDDCSNMGLNTTPSAPTIMEFANAALENFNLISFSPGIVCVSDDPFFSLITQDSLTCPSLDDGSFTVLVDEGLAPYRFFWNTVPVSGPNNGPEIIGANGGATTIINLPAGSYQITITDASIPFLEVIDTIVIFAGPVLGITIRDTVPSCFGETDGSLRFLPTSDGFPIENPGPGYSFIWSVPNGVALPGNTNYISNIPSGSYGITVTDPAGCQEIALIPLGQPPALRILDNNTFITDASCTGGGDGEITITAIGGTSLSGNYTYEWDTGLTIQANTSTLTGLNPGEYCVMVTDDNGCSEERCFTVGATKVLSINSLPTDVLCNGDNTGNLLITGSTSGAPAETPYTFVWSANAPAANNTATTSELTNLAAMTYTVTMTDNGGVCEVIEDFTINEPEPLVSSILFTNETCTTGNDGSITLTVTGGVMPYTYTWLHDAFLTGPDAVGLSQGEYTIDITDANGCTLQQTQTISAPIPPLVSSFPDVAVTCSDDTDAQLLVTVIPAPGTIIVDYTWNTGAAGANVNSINNLPPGEYIVTITADNACITIDTAYVTAPDPITLGNIEITMPSCPGENTGRINILAAGGTSPYTYLWSNGSNVSVNSQLSAGDYELTITDDNGCVSETFIITVTDPPSIIATFSNAMDTSCPDDLTCDGQLTVTAGYSDGTTGDFIFTWASGEITNTGNTSTAIQLCEGTQIVNVNDGCAIEAEFTINSPEPISVLPSINPVSCNGGTDGSVSVVPSGGTAPYDFLWLETGDVTPGIDNLSQGAYSVVITDANNCTFTQNLAVNEPLPLTLSIDPFQTTEFVTCAGDMDGLIVVTATGGNLTPAGPYTFVWSDNNNGGTLNANLAAGTYSVTVTDFKNCMDEVSYTILEPDPLTFSLNPIEPPLCFGDATVITIDTVFGGANNPFEEYTFEVDNNGLNFPVLQAATVFAGDHVVTVQDINGCTEEISVSIASPDQINIDLPTSIVIELGDSTTQLSPTITPGGQYSYQWTPADYLSNDTIRNPFVFPGSSLNYTLTIVNENGCIATESVFVELDANRNVYIPNVFSPNGDGLNDKFEIFTCLGVSQVNAVRIFDRWGGIVYENINIDPECLGIKLWDGDKNDRLMPQAVYVYMVEVTFLDGVILIYRGDVTLIR